MPRLSRKLKRRLNYFFLALLALLIAIPLADRRRDQETIPDPRRDVADADNVLAGIVDAMPVSASPSQDPAATTPAEKQAWLDKYAPLFAALDAACARPEIAWHKPTVATTFGTRMDPWPAKLREWARLNARRSRTQFELGQTAAGLKTAAQSLRVCRGAARGGAMMINYLVAVAMEAVALGGLTGGLGPVPPDAHGDPTSAWPTSGWDEATKRAWRDMRDQLLAWHEEPAAGQETLAVEYRVQAEAYRDPTWLGSASAIARCPNPFYLPGDTVRRARQYYTAALEYAALPAWERDPSTLPDLKPHGTGYVLNSVGKIMLSMMVPVIEKMIERSDLRTANARITTAQIALKLFLEDHGRLPRDWSELVAGGDLPSVPQDTCRDAPLGYLPAEGKVYSVGANGKDDHGERNSHGADDFCRELAFVVDVDATAKKKPTPSEAPTTP